MKHPIGIYPSNDSHTFIRRVLERFMFMWFIFHRSHFELHPPASQCSTGFGCGGFNADQVAWIINIWRHKAAPFILSLHFEYSAGTLGLIPPFILRTCRSEEDKACNETRTNKISIPRPQ
ncbi:unnamed protein product [Allacma fusca]|uniref:Uncharacterized protein n=1 Tax=Allacma fusca TaxID=39272 RepID=A0A8J2PD29_9HEXA|nr:unnamed protein product [Allacma fusca]